MALEFSEQDVLVYIAFRDRLYANMDELYAQVPQEEVDPYGYGDETIYDSICYYRSPVSRQTVIDLSSTTFIIMCSK